MLGVAVIDMEGMLRVIDADNDGVANALAVRDNEVVGVIVTELKTTTSTRRMR